MEKCTIWFNYNLTNVYFDIKRSYLNNFLKKILNFIVQM